jgi:hypothetical protein
MKLKSIISLLAIVLLGSSLPTLAQKKGCSFDIVGTWKAQLSPTEAVLYRFDSTGGVTVLSVTGTSEPKEIATAKYAVIDELNEPKSIAFTATGKNRIFGAARKTLKVVSYDDSSMTCSIPGMENTRWTRVDPDRYFMVLSARTEEFYDHTGSVFPMVIKVAGGVPTIDVFGIYAVNGQIAFGTVPPSAYKDHLREARKDSETTLRLEINARQYGRALKIIKEWERRHREGALLYGGTTLDTSEDPTSLNTILIVKAVTETLNQCSEDFDLYKLTYNHPEDWITGQYRTALVPFAYFKELRRRNEARHIDDKKFRELVPLPDVAKF